MWKWLEQYFTFTRGEKNGVLILVLLSVAAFITPSVYFYFKPVEHINNSKYDNYIDAFINEYNQRKQLAIVDTLSDSTNTNFNPYANVDLNSQFKRKEKRSITYFNFDPNKIGVEEWMKLGFSEKQAESIEKLKAKGFKFYKPEDLKSVFVVGEVELSER